MEGFLFKAFVSQSQTSLLLVGLTLLVTLALSQLETLMAILTMWHALPRGFLGSPALAFLLLNCVIVTMIASSKFASDQKSQGYEEESEEDTMEQLIHGKGDKEWGLVAEDRAYNLDTPLKSVYDYQNEEYFLRRISWSLNAKQETNITKREQAKLSYVNEKKASRKARLTSRRNDKVGLHYPNKPLSSDQKNKQHINKDSLKICSWSEAGSQHYSEKPAPQSKFDTTMATEKCIEGCAETLMNNLSAQQTKVPAAAATAAAHPSLEEVWAAIMASNKTDQDHRMACKPAAATGAATPPAAAAAPDSPPLVVLHKTPLAAASAAAAPNIPVRAAKLAPINLGAEARSKPHTAAAEKQANGDGNNRANDLELEELNCRAEEFIARFNSQMRLQREESLQRQKRGRRPCNYEVQCPEHAIVLQVPA